MNIKIVKKTSDEVKIEFEGESHTLLNLLRTELLADDRVVFASYDNKFPIMDNPIFRIKTKDIDPIQVIREAARRIENQCEEFSLLFAETVK
jgi:DNA-directed RNA polymerase subunit L